MHYIYSLLYVHLNHGCKLGCFQDASHLSKPNDTLLSLGLWPPCLCSKKVFVPLKKISKIHAHQDEVWVVI